MKTDNYEARQARENPSEAAASIQSAVENLVVAYSLAEGIKDAIEERDRKIEEQEKEIERLQGVIEQLKDDAAGVP